ncbi:MAG: hypothetical protein E4H27_00390 [Anaerolineales bacterium]|nr:MAG: hypothetical protein E4H27_00390 [Anaerolineales bacterium]
MIDQLRNTLYDTQTKVLPSGMFDGSFALDDLIPAGSYSLALVLDETNVSLNSSASIIVRHKVWKKFDVAVYSNTSNLYVGDTLRFFVSAVDVPANVLADTPFTWQIISEPDFQMTGSYIKEALPSPFTWNTTEIIRESTPVTFGVGTTDAFGHATIDIPTDDSLPIFGNNFSREQLWRLRIQFDNDDGDPEITESVVHVKKSSYRLGILLKSRVIEPGKGITFDVLALHDDWDPVVGASIVVTLSKLTEFADEPPDALTLNDAIPDKKVIVTTDAQGKASGFFSNNASGAYAISAALTDQKGQTIVSTEKLWIGGSETATSSLHSQYLYPVTDKKIYNVGDVAQVLLPISYTGSYQLLLTLERESILYTEILAMEGANPIIEVPILDNYFPNVYASFTAILPIDDAWKVTQSGYVEILVHSPDNLLHIQVSADQDYYHPGDQALVRIRITDADMLPVDADVFVALQEKIESTLSFTQELFNDIAGPLPLQVASGNALLMSTIESSYRNTGDLYQHSDKVVDHNLNYANVPETLLVRFEKQPASDGEVILSVDVPDSQESWQINVSAVTQHSQFGVGQGEIAVTGTIGIQAILPSVFVAEDLGEIKTIIRNLTGVEQKLTLAFVPVEGIDFAGNDNPQGIVLPPFSQRILSWQVSIPNANSVNARFQIAVSGEDYQAVYSSGAGKGIPILHYFSPEPRVTSGIMSGEDHFVDIIPVPITSLRNTSLSVYVESQITGAFISGLEYFDAYPVNTTDVIADRLLTRLNVEKLFANIFDESGAAPNQISSTVATELEMIYSRQNDDGGWGWWLSISNLQMSSYVTLGIIRAKEAGYPIRTTALDKALDFITSSITETVATGEKNASLAVGLYALSMAEREWPINVASRLYEDHSLWGVSGKAYLALALGVRDPVDPRIGTLVKEIVNVADASSSFGVHWNDRNSQTMNTDAQTTAVVLDMLLSLDGEYADISGIANYLISVRNGKTWDSPLETAWALDALAKYATSMGLSEPTYNWTITLNNQSLLDSSLLDKNVDSAASMIYEKYVTLKESSGVAFINGENTIEYTRGAGVGKLYYSSRLNLAVPMSEITPESRGLSIVREYCHVPEGSLAKVSYLDTHCSPIQTVPNGSELEARLTILNPETRYHLTVIDFIPSGFLSLNETGYIITDIRGQTDQQSQPFVYRLCNEFECQFYADVLEPGTYQIIYRLKANIPGLYHALPAKVYEVYNSEVWAQSHADQLTILKQ